jgi:hypothetical protein
VPAVKAGNGGAIALVVAASAQRTTGSATDRRLAAPVAD